MAKQLHSSLWGLYCLSSCSFCQQSVEGVNSVAWARVVSSHLLEGLCVSHPAVGVQQSPVP